jgi:arabinogalactan oligomer / maltooligosaccharide transport system permease protein
MTTQTGGGPALRDLPFTEPEPPPTTAGRSVGLTGLTLKVLLLGFVVAIAVWAAFPLVDGDHWIGLGILVATTALLLYVYLTPRHIPAKYLVPGTVFLVVFQVFPVLYTVTTAATNYGDGHRGSKADAVVAIQTASVTRVPGSAEYALSIATTGDPATGRLTFLITDAVTKKIWAGDAEGLEELPTEQATVSAAGRVLAARGYQVLTVGQASARSKEITELAVPTAGGAIRSSGLSRAYEGKAGQVYDAATDSVRDTSTGKVWTADDSIGSFVSGDGERLAQGWKVSVGFENFSRVLTDQSIAGPFLRTLVWNLLFALASTGLTFMLGMFIAVALHSRHVRFRNLYRILLVLPYAMPSFAMLLVWRDMFNTDFGLINHVLGVHTDWFGGNVTAKLAVLLVQLWLGYPYMFLVATGALQAIPGELIDATKVDGAGAWQAFRSITMPLLLVALTPLLISSFAFNFNNANAILLTTEGAPFPADNPLNGGTDLLITYTYRLAFGGSGAQYGLAAAISIFIFLIVGVVSAVSFHRTRKQEEVYS